MGAFQELGLSADVVSGLDRLGYVRPTAIQRAAIPVLRRGGNALIHAASGAGVTGAYGLALIDRLRELGEIETVRALVVTPTAERASAIALELGQLGQSAGVRAAVLGPAWSKAAAIVVVPAHDILPLMQSSVLKLDDLAALVLHDASTLLELGAGDALDSLMPAVPRGAQRIVVTTELNPAIEKLADAHARKALHIPPRPADGDPQGGESGTLEYEVTNPSGAREAVAERVAGSASKVVYCRRESDRAALEEELALRGLRAAVRLYVDAESDEPSLGLGAPFDAETFRTAFGAGGLVVIALGELPHLKHLAVQTRTGLRVAATRAAPEQAGLESFRESIRRALREEDVDAQLLVIEPLLAEFSAAEVAAAVTSLLRKRTAVAPAAADRTAPTGSAPPAFAKLFLSIGSRDTISAREIVGAITGEAGVAGDQIGKVEIRDTFSVVEVAAEVAERVIRSLNGTSLRGRSLRVDYDRKPSTQRRVMPVRRTRPPRQ
ncbi:MAG: DEAD/DEAH box helicase [Gemmatimonadota bacterium]